MTEHCYAPSICPPPTVATIGGPVAWRPYGWSASVHALIAAQVVPPWPADRGAFDAALAALATRPDDAIGLEVTVPFCLSHCLCCERDVHVAQPESVIDGYISSLEAELALLAGQLGPGRDVLSLHLGQGTANELSPAQLARLVDVVSRHCRLPAEAVLVADCDPRRTGWLQLRVLRRLGFRRLAFGVLDLDGAVQAAIGRAQSPALVADACQTARDSGIESIELRLMVGLPRQTLDSWRSTLRRLITMAPDRIALCRYHHQPQWAPAQYAIDADSLPDAELCQELVRCAATMLCEAGYEWLGADLFVLETDELALAREQGRLRCSPGGFSATAPLPQLGLGVGALSAIEGGLFWNAAPMQAWCAAVQAGRATVVHGVPADAEGLRRRDAVERLLCQMQLPRPADADGLQPAFERLRAHQADGALIAGPGSVLVTEAGRHRLPELCAAFAAPSRVLQLT
jgi:oxygen-independent coproporphyrinogen III oxidase